MHSRLGLVALWAVFAAASVGVGFGAAGLVADPFTATGGDQVTLADSRGANDSAAPLASGSTTPAPRRTGSASPSSGGTPVAPAPVVRSLTTRGGLVSGSCTRGLVTVSAAPTVGWSIKDVEGGPTQEARVRFERTGDGEGRVEVRAHCVGGVPRFSVQDGSGSGGSGDDGGGSGGGSGGGGDDGGGSGSSGSGHD